MVSQKRRKSPVLRLLLILFLMILMLPVSIYVVPLYERSDKTAVEGSEDWMKELPDDRVISEILLPGTHDSATRNVQLPYFSKCQNLSIREQLDAGFRYLDIRLALSEDGVKLVHGFTDCTESFGPFAKTLMLSSVLSDCYDFLQEHPTELIVFVAANQGKEEETEKLQNALLSAVNERPDAWLLTDHLPTVGEARGKIVLFIRYPDDADLGQEAGLPLRWAEQDNRTPATLHTETVPQGPYTLCVQDRYKYGTENKWLAFLSGLGNSEASGDSISLNFLSTNGTAKFGHPYKFARNLNTRLLKADGSGLKGWIIVDFASPKLAEHIYSENFR